ncbi:MAG: extracellular solute-binding protein [Clostridiales bacterium]|nr:extracellular solute-binding protein [Clostridiales bacterium]
MKKAKRLIAGVITLAMAMPLFTSCGQKKSEDVISASDPWYDVTSTTLSEELDPTLYEYAYMEFAGLCDSGYVYTIEAIKLVPEGFNYQTDSMMDLVDDMLVVFDYQGNKIASISISDYIKNSDFEGMATMNAIHNNGNGWTVAIAEYDMLSGEQTVYNVPLDITTGEFGEPVVAEVPDELSEIIESGASEEEAEYVGDYEIRKFWISGDVPSYALSVTDPDGNATLIDLREIFPGEIIYDISSIIDMGNNKAFINATDYQNSRFFVLDFTTMQVTDVQDDMSWLSNDIDNICSVEGIGAAIINDDGVYSVDFDTQTVEPLFMFSDSNVNQYDVSNFTAVKITEDECIFTGTSSLPTGGISSMLDTTALVYTFNRAESNPNEGKTIIEVASVQDFSYALCNAVCEFNTNSEDYFIKLISKYNLDKYNDEETEEGMAANDNASVTLSNQLAIDLMAGEGPDIIINASSLNMLNNSDYLLDMSGYVAENFSNGDEYFTNLFDARTVDGALYQIPLAVSVVGISTSVDNVEEGQTGFTFEQYEEFVEGPCNGVSPFSGDQTDVFIQLVDCMQDSFIHEGQVNFDTPEFRALAEFVRDNVYEQPSDNDNEIYQENSEDASVCYISDIYTYFDSIASKNNTILGLPSYDGRGPVIYDCDSVAISALTPYPEACNEFVSVLLGEASQDIYAYYQIPVNRNSFNRISLQYIEAYNQEISLMLRIYNEAMLTSIGMNTQMMEESDIPPFEEFVEGITNCFTNDGSINSIIREEIPSFLEGQKSLDEIIPLLNDRVNTVLVERG